MVISYLRVMGWSSKSPPQLSITFRLIIADATNFWWWMFTVWVHRQTMNNHLTVYQWFTVHELTLMLNCVAHILTRWVHRRQAVARLHDPRFLPSTSIPHLVVFAIGDIVDHVPGQLMKCIWSTKYTWWTRRRFHVSFCNFLPFP